MKTLNRPMFRYGGPIKEGVMNGIREPKRNGGSMANNEGPRRAALVGNPIYPKVDGRTNHVIPAVLGAGSLIGRFIAPAFGRYVAKQIPKLYKSGKKAGEQIGKKTTTLKDGAFEPNKFGNFFASDPLAKTVASGAGFTGKALQKVGGGIKYATTTPSGLVFLGAPVTYAAGKYFLDSGEEIKGKDLEKIEKRGTSGAPGGGDPGMYLTPEGEQPKELTPAEREALEAEARMKKMDKYKEIMDIKGMNKDAAYKSLIDASKIIQEGGNLKEQLKDGSLITKITAAASKRFDKVGDTEAALRSLVAKGEIENEMNKETKALDREYKQSAIDINKKKLKGSSTSEVIQSRMLKGEYPTGSELAALIRINNPQINAKVLPSGGMEQGQDPLEYITQTITAVNADETTPDYPEGVYIIKDRIIQVIDGNVIPIPLSSLN